LCADGVDYFVGNPQLIDDLAVENANAAGGDGAMANSR
jgi:hypothetical protein